MLRDYLEPFLILPIQINWVAFIRRHIDLLFVFILPVYLYIVQNTIQNEHTHVYANGVVVKHAHPFEKDGEAPINEHEHSKQEICLYSSLHLDFYVSPDLVNIEIPHAEIQRHYLIANEQAESLVPFNNSIPRAPPV